MKNGFTLIEILTVIAIISIIIIMGIPSILSWLEKYKIEGDTNKIYSFIQNAREKAFSEKIKLKISIDDKNICIKCDSSDSNCTDAYGTGNIECSSLNYRFTGGTVNISKRGTLSKITIYYPSSNDASYDCVITSTTRIKMEKCNGNPQ